ncbi:hypothetical protein YC2023_090663 [Brassica napus]
MADSGERNRSQRKLKPETSSTGDSRDFISSMPDEILHHIISFNTTKLAVKTSVLSRRWRHVWCETSCLSFRGLESTARGINQTLISYRSLKLTSFRLDNAYYATAAREINPCFSRKCVSREISSLEQLDLKFALIPICTTVSWKILRNLTLSSCNFSYDESIARISKKEFTTNILSGCPILETLEVIYCHGLPRRLDLSKSLNLRRLEIKWTCQSSYPVEIIAPHIHYLKLSTYKEPCTLVDVSSVTRHGHGSDIRIFEEQRKSRFWLLFESTRFESGSMLEIRIYSELSYLKGKIYPMVRCENAASKLFTSLMEVGLRNSKTLEMMVVQFKSTPLALECFAQLLQMPPTLPHNNNDQGGCGRAEQLLNEHQAVGQG